MPLRKKSIGESAVVIQAFHAWGAGSRRLNTRPGDGEAIALLVETLGQCYVLRIKVVLVAGNVACNASPYFPRGMSKSVPDGFALAVLVPCTLILIGRRGNSPKKTFRESRPLYQGFGNSPGNLIWDDWASGVTATAIEGGPGGCGQRTNGELTTIHR